MGTVRWIKTTDKGHLVIKEIHKVIVYRFRLGDVEDPEIYAAQPLYEWQQTEQGKFVMEHAIDKPTWHKFFDPITYGYKCSVVAELDKKHLVEFYLRWGKPNGND